MTPRRPDPRMLFLAGALLLAACGDNAPAEGGRGQPPRGGAGPAGPSATETERAPIAPTAPIAQTAPPAPPGSPPDEGRTAFETFRRAVETKDTTLLFDCFSSRLREEVRGGAARELASLRADPDAAARFRAESGYEGDLAALAEERFIELVLRRGVTDPASLAYLDRQWGSVYRGSRAEGDRLTIAAEDLAGSEVRSVWFREEGRWRIDRLDSLDASARIVRKWSTPGGRVQWLALSSDGLRLAEWGEDRQLRIWETENPAEPRTLGGIEGTPILLAFRDDGTLAVATIEGRLFLFAEARGAPRVVDLGEYVVAAIPRGGARFAIWRQVGVVEIRDFETQAVTAVLPFLSRFVSGLAISPDGSRLAIRSGLRIALFDVATGDRIVNLPGLAEWATIRFAADGRHVGAVRAGYLYFWDCATGLEAGQWPLGEDPGGDHVLLPGGARVAAAARRSVRFGNAARHRGREARLQGAVTALVAGADGRRVAVGFEGGGVAILEADE